MTQGHLDLDVTSKLEISENVYLRIERTESYSGSAHCSL